MSLGSWDLDLGRLTPYLVGVVFFVPYYFLVKRGLPFVVETRSPNERLTASFASLPVNPLDSFTAFSMPVMDALQAPINSD